MSASVAGMAEVRRMTIPMRWAETEMRVRQRNEREHGSEERDATWCCG